MLVGFSLVPLLSVFRYAFWDWSGLSPPTAAGWANFARLLSDRALLESLRITLLFALITLPLFIYLSYAIAVAIYGLRVERFVKALLFLPGLTTVGGSAVAWYLLYNPDYGLVRELTGLSLPWSSEPWAALAYIVLFTLWLYTGYGVLVMSAALRGIPEAVKEAARVDGANEAQVRRFIVAPLLRPALLFLAVIGTIFSIQSYTAVFLLTRGGPFGSTRVLGYYLFETAFERFQLGYAAALTVFILIITIVVVVVQARFLADRRMGT